MFVVCRFIFVSVLLLVTSSLFAKTPPTFAFWNGAWEGTSTTFSATGERLEDSKVEFVSELDATGLGTLQKIQLTCKSSRGYTEKEFGFYMLDKRGMRRVIKSSTGELISDLRGRPMGPHQIYWFDIDVNGCLREAYIETLYGDIAEVHGFRWDGEKTGSYRLVEARYTKRKNELTSSKGTIP